MSKTRISDERFDDDDIYEDDFEKINDDIEEVIDDDEEFLKKLGFIADDGKKCPSDHNFVTPPTSRMTIESVSPESDSAGNKLNSKHDFETMTSFDDYDEFNDDYEEEEDASTCLSYDFRLFQASLNQLPIGKQKKYKNGTRSSLTFSNQRMEEIQRENKHLLDKIMRNGPAGDGYSSRKQGSNKANRASLPTSAEVNRRKKQQKIEYENLILKRKLDKIASRRS